MKYLGIIGREEEFKRLEKCYNSNQSQLIIVSGRRRVGKTYLIDEVFEDDFVFKFTGSRDLSFKDQLKNFANELKRRTNIDITPKTWSEAFELLRDYLESLDKTKKFVVFFDEMPWIDTPKSKFIDFFEYFWNDYGSSKKNLLFIVCGSSSSWIQDKILKNKGGLFNRHSALITLKPFTLIEVEKYLKSMNIHWSRMDIIRLYMLIGGIPYYLNYLDSSLTLSENIDNIFFNENAYLKDEFNILYSTLFENNEDILKIVEVLGKQRYGMDRYSISLKTKLAYNGHLSKLLSSLEVSGFIQPFTKYGNRKEVYYRLSDYYSLFYLKFVKNQSNNDHQFWSNSFSNQARINYEALGFELICANTIDKIKNALSIGGVLSSNYPWSKKGNADEEGSQIDLVIERKDHVITICEIKFSNTEFEIDKDYSAKLLKKIEVFRKDTKTRDSIQLVLVSPYGLKKNMYSNIINKTIIIDDLF